MPSSSPSGKLIVITGRPAAGKDFVAQILQSDPQFAHWEFSRLVTYASRPPRPGESHGVEHYFISYEELIQKHLAGELVEPPILTGSTYKATPKAEFHRVLHEGKNLYWRIDPSLAVQVAQGDFYEKQFSSTQSQYLKASTLVIFVDAPKDTLDRRRRLRDGANFNSTDYEQRDHYEQEIFSQNSDVFSHVVQNLEDHVDKLKHQLFQLISTHMER